MHAVALEDRPTSLEPLDGGRRVAVDRWQVDHTGPALVHRLLTRQRVRERRQV